MSQPRMEILPQPRMIILIKYNITGMNLAVAIVTYLIIATIIVALLCLAIRYFHNRMQKSINDPNYTFSIFEGIEDQEEDLTEADYDQFLQKRAQSRKPPNQLEIKDIKSPFNTASTDIYSGSKTRSSPGKIPGVIRRIMATPKNEVVDDMEPFSIRRDSIMKASLRSRTKPVNITLHKYCSKMVSYSDQGLSVVESKVKEIWKQSEQGPILENKQIRRSIIQPNEVFFKDTLQVYGFQEGEYMSYKYETSLEIPNMRENQVYQVTSLKSKETKEQIGFHSFYINRDKMEDNMHEMQGSQIDQYT